MCATCGCEGVVHTHTHGHEHHHDHDHDHDHGRIVSLEQRVLAKNDEIAAKNRAWVRERGITLINLLSGPGAGKTALLERTIRRASGPKPFVIEGDQATDRDAARIRRAGATAIQINTGTGCHLDAAMVQKALAELAPPRGTLVFVENVGNLVCPALFDLGEHAKVVIVSVAEGDDKPLKYPHMILASDLLIVQKLDLLPHVSFDVELCISNARRVKAALPAIALSARSGQGMASWYDWLATRHEEVERA